MYEDTKIIGFAGFCKSDIILYLSRILYLTGDKVAVIDRSHEQELYYHVPAESISDDRLEYRGIDVYLRCQNIPLKDFPVKDYQVVLVDLGVNSETYEDVKLLKVLYIVTDCNRHHTIPLSAWLRNLATGPDSVRIIRDTVYGKIRPRYIDSLLQAGQVTNVLAKYEFRLNDDEYSTRLLCQYDDIYRFAKIPEDYKNMLMDCITEIFGKEVKSARKALRKAQMGG
ncbi:MAG TPA: hypothetical protein VIL05_10285 [Thermoclostridium sp.]